MMKARGQVLAAARASGGEVRMSNLQAPETGGYVAHVLGVEDVDDPLAEYIFETSGGNPFGINVLCAHLQKKAVIQFSDDNEAALAPEWEDPDRLEGLEYPAELVGTVLETFEKLEPAERELLKHAAVWDLARSSNIHDFQESLGEPKQKIQERCLFLILAGILKNAEPTRRLIPRRRSNSVAPRPSGVSGARPSMFQGRHSTWHRRSGALDMLSADGIAAVTFASTLHRHVALALVLKSPMDSIKTPLPLEDACSDPDSEGNESKFHVTPHGKLLSDVEEDDEKDYDLGSPKFRSASTKRFDSAMA